MSTDTGEAQDDTPGAKTINMRITREQRLDSAISTGDAHSSLNKRLIVRVAQGHRTLDKVSSQPLDWHLFRGNGKVTTKFFGKKPKGALFVKNQGAGEENRHLTTGRIERLKEFK